MPRIEFAVLEITCVAGLTAVRVCVTKRICLYDLLCSNIRDDIKESASLSFLFNAEDSDRVTFAQLFQVSILLIPNFGPPIAACAVREVLSEIAHENVSEQPTIIVPFIMKDSKFNREAMNLSSFEQNVALFGAAIGATTDFTQAMIAKVATVSSTLQLNCEPLACLLHMVRVLGVPTVLLIASDSQNWNRRSTNYELEVSLKYIFS